MATWFEITFTGDPTENDFERVAELAAQGFTSGQLISEPGDEETEGPATGYPAQPLGEGYAWLGLGKHEHRYQGQTLRHAHKGGSNPHGYFGHPEDVARARQGGPS